MSSQDKKHNVRIEKWRSMMEDGTLKDKTLLQNRIRKGIPNGIRIIAWPEIVQLKTFISSKSYTYQKLTKQFSNNIYEISLDIPRTFPEEEDNKVLRKSLNNVLKSISIIYPKIGYCQGMNFSALRLLQILDDETTFWLLHYVYENDSAIMHNFIEPKSIERENEIFTILMQQKLPKHYSNFEKKKVTYQAYTIKWFMTLYSSNFSQELFYRIFEVFLNEGWSIIFAVGLALLKNNEKELLSKNTEEIFFMLSSEIYTNINNLDDFMMLAYSFELSEDEINKLRQQYDFKRDLTMRDSSRLRYNKEIEKRQESNKTARKMFPVQENLGMLNFQNKSEELNFEIFDSLSFTTDPKESQRKDE